MRTSSLVFCSLALVATSALHAEQIKGTVATPPPESAEKKAKPTGAVVWVENVKDAKAPDKKQSLSQKDGQFNPPVLVAVVGQTVDFPNDDNIAHNVFSMSAAKKFNLGIYPKGESKDVVFEKAGIIDVFCSLHRHMHAKIVVVPSVHYAMCDPTGAFEIKDVPAGTYKVTAWSDGCAPKTMDVTVADGAGGTAAFTLVASKAQTASAEGGDAGAEKK